MKACPDLLGHFLSTFKWPISGFRGLFQIVSLGAVNGGKHVNGGVPKKGDVQSKYGTPFK